ncbi:hypothetical protein EJ04DRAFT_550620 [Polyplosphaeria fusca]|uniref:Uncharacterized protein n=1 Tax=Polyplosphaeria fusca TaxID=682080 RepID=A0A9P4R5R3_9PLEO|nr:hypothetical protein EJ04DRAFT_550620 [Polyplosphaeria fusca]
MSLIDNYHVHLGFWTNWSHGDFAGATLTLTRRNGGLLIAFIAIFVGATGKSFWRIACYLLHRLLSSPTPRDGIYHQTQAILRNCDTAQDAAWGLSQIIWAWKVPARIRQPFPRLAGIISLALTISISFGIAGVFSSHITTDTANEVILTGANCGPLRGNDEVDFNAYTNLFEPHQWQRVTAYNNYALQCYSGNISTSEDCHPYVRAKLKTSVIRNASCPFSSTICRSQTENLIVDTGFINSHADLGINSRPEDRFEVRFLHHCAPIVTEGFRKNETVNGTEMTRYYYGPLSYGEEVQADFTQEIAVNASNSYQEYRTYKARARADYGISVLKAYGGPLEQSKTFSMFTPIQQLSRTDADIGLWFLSAQGLTFTDEVDDPIFSAHRQGPRKQGILNDSLTKPSYLHDGPLRVLGCAMQMQFCNPNLPEDRRCEPLRGTIDDSYPVTDLYNSKSQKTGFQWAIDIIRLGFFSISGIVDALGISALVARQGLAANMQGPLPSNQWQIEVEHWVGASMASIQGSFVETGNGPAPLYQQFRRAPNETAEKNMCENQKIMTTKYSSFSVLGVGLILGIGGLIMLLDIFLELLVDYIESRRRRSKGNTKHSYARVEWNTNTTLQLQRLAHEQVGAGDWKSATWLAHPVTAPGEELAMFDLKREHHPKLVNSMDWGERSVVTELEVISEEDDNALEDIKKTSESEITDADIKKKMERVDSKFKKTSQRKDIPEGVAECLDRVFLSKFRQEMAASMCATLYP